MQPYNRRRIDLRKDGPRITAMATASAEARLLARAGRVRGLAAASVLACVIGLGVGVLVAQSALRAPPVLRARIADIDPPPGLGGPREGAAEVETGAAAPFVLAAVSAEDRSRARRCLADAIYYEAALEPLEGRRAVAQVVLNRVRDPNFPKSICGVVYDGWNKPPGCQFSFACDGSLTRAPIPGLYKAALDIAEQAMAGRVEPEVGLATHYHATSVDPWWRGAMVKIAQIGSQIFYRWPGEAGRPGAFTGRYAGHEQVPPTSALLAQARSAPPAAGSPALAVAAAPAAEAAADDQVTYFLGRRVRSRAEVQQMNRWLEERRPEVAANDPTAP